MNIMVAEDLYPESLPGDEPEPLPQVRWPLAQLMSLLDEEDLTRPVTSARCFSAGMAAGPGPTLNERPR